MNTQSLQDFLELDDDNNALIDMKMSLGNAMSSPSEILNQIKAVTEAGKAGKLNNFVDFHDE